MNLTNNEQQDVIFSRRSIRNFIDQKVESEKVDRLIRAAMQAPSAMNQQPWEYIVVEKKDTIEKLANFDNINSTPLGKSTLAIVVLADERRLKVPDAWQQDLGAATQNILLEAATLGLGSVWIGISTRPEKTESVSTFFELPEYIKPYSIVAVGYPDGEENVFVDRYQEDRVHHESW